MKNCVTEGRRVNLIATANVVGGNVYKYGACLFVAMSSVSTGQGFAGMVSGEVKDVPKVSGSAWTEMQALYWSGTAFTHTPTGPVVAWARPALSGATTGQVVLIGASAT